MAEAKGKGGRPKILVRRHTIELPKEILALAGSFSKDFKKPRAPRIIGAALTAAGVFLLSMGTAAMMKGVIDNVVRFTVGHSIRTVNFFSGLLGKFTKIPTFGLGVVELKEPEPVPEELIETLGNIMVEELEKVMPGITMVSLSIAITAGGMVLAGQNPAELIKGLAALIDSLIPG